jgi:hypothetical protein
LYEAWHGLSIAALMLIMWGNCLLAGMHCSQRKLIMTGLRNLLGPSAMRRIRYMVSNPLAKIHVDWGKFE